MDLYQIWFMGSSRRRNHLCRILLQSAQGSILQEVKIHHLPLYQKEHLVYKKYCFSNVRVHALCMYVHTAQVCGTYIATRWEQTAAATAMKLFTGAVCVNAAVQIISTLLSPMSVINYIEPTTWSYFFNLVIQLRVCL